MEKCTIELVNGQLPKRMTKGSAAYDLYCPEDTIIKPGRNKVPLGIKLHFQDDIEALIEARSNFQAEGFEGFWMGDTEKKNPYRFDADVLPGKIDSDFPGIINVTVKSCENMPFVCAKGTRLAQLTFVRICHPEFEIGTVEQTTDRNGGYGSTKVNQ